jgi:transglutaminase-like putative cysteine protease
MVLRSLSPLRAHRRFFALFACSWLTSVSGFAQTMFLTVDCTPYDAQMTRVSDVLNADTGPRICRTSLAALNHWISRLRAMPYYYSPRWRTPEEVNSAQVGDCKGKAVALYEELRANGARNVRLVIGKHRASDLRTHAWVEWETPQGTFLLDPTFNWTAAKTDHENTSTYIPFYAYESGRKYRAFNPALMSPQYSLSAQVASRE